MNKEEAKQYLRNQIDSSVKRQQNEHVFDLCYNKQYLRALKISKITGNPVNKENFKGGEMLFWFYLSLGYFCVSITITNYLYDHYSNDYNNHKLILEEVFNEYDEYKSCKYK